MHISNLFVGRRARVLSAAAGAVIQPLEARRLLTTMYVDSTATGRASGLDWNNAFPTLGAALSAAQSGDQINVAQGMYTPGTNRTDTFQLVSGVTIQGGYEGLAANSMFGSPDNRDVDAFPTILSGDIGNSPDNSDNSYHVVTASGVDSNASLDGFTITGGNADGSGDTNSALGAGLFNVDGSPQISHCTFTNNTASDGGGAVYDYISFSTNSSFDNCTFTQNSAVNNGGAIDDQAGSPSIFSCTFTDNTAGGNGGALDAENGLIMGSCVFTRNSAGGAGGAIKFASFADIYQSLFTGNSAARGSAVENDFGAQTTFISCAFVGNSSNGTGATDGGTVYDNQFSTVSLIGCTLTANVADVNTAGVYNVNSSPAITNCILWNNTVGGSTIAEVYDADAGSSPTTTYTDVDGYAGPNSSNNFDTDPQFQRNPSRGDDNVWGTDDDDYGNVGLQFTSPLIDVGNTSATQATNDGQDLANHNRIVSNIVDLGAYEAQIVYVDLNATGNSFGADWADAFTDLNVAIGSAPDGALIKVAKGTYTGSFSLQPPFGSQGVGIILQGGYAGVQASDPDARNITTNVTTLSGGGVATHVVDVSNTDSTTVLDGFTITGGNANGPQDSRNNVGGGIYDLGGSPTIKNCIITNNSAQYYGGIYNSANTGVNPPIPSAPTLIDCTFSNNTNGAMGDNGDSPTLIGCAFTNNVLGTSGAGAINCSSEQMTLTDCTFSGNSANNSGAGGAINCSSGELFMTDCSFISNTAADGGAINFDGNEMTAVNCLFVDNTATGWAQFMDSGRGGAITIDGFPFEVAITNSTFSGNTAPMAGSLGGAIYEVTANPVITNCIFWNDSAETGSEIYDDPRRNDGSTVNHSDVDGGFTGTGNNNINADPKFVDPTHGNFQLMSGSPAIDQGDDTAIAGTSTDLAGDARVSGAHVDMGAYEVQVVAFSVVSTSFEFDTGPFINFTLNGDAQLSTYNSSKVSLNRVNADGSLTPVSASASSRYGSRVFGIFLPSNFPDGNYRVSLNAGAIKDTSGDSVVASAPYDFFVLAGDANHDRTVNALDFNALATNYGTSADFVHGNFNYSGMVDSNDFALLAARFGTHLAIPPGFTGMAMPAAVGMGTNHTTASLFSDSKVAAADWLNSSDDSLDTL